MRSNDRITRKIYYFNIDIIYVLKARIFILKKTLKEKLNNNERLYDYICSKYRKGCNNNESINEFEFDKNKCCPKCKSPMIIDQKSKISTDVQKDANRAL